MQTMDASLAGLVRENKITMAAAEARSSEPAEMRKLVHSPAAAVTSAPPASVAA
jgi:twitching motility protein PilT